MGIAFLSNLDAECIIGHRQKSKTFMFALKDNKGKLHSDKIAYSSEIRCGDAAQQYANENDFIIRYQFTHMNGSYFFHKGVLGFIYASYKTIERMNAAYENMLGEDFSECEVLYMGKHKGMWVIVLRAE